MDCHLFVICHPVQLSCVFFLFALRVVLSALLWPSVWLLCCTPLFGAVLLVEKGAVIYMWS